MEEQGHLLVDRVVGEQQVAFVVEVLVDELVGDPLQAERRLGSMRERAPERAEQLHRLAGAHLC
jgi:hypothetical protein